MLLAVGVLLALTTVVDAVGFLASAASLDPEPRMPLGVAGLLACGLAWAARASGRRAAVARGLLVVLVLGVLTWLVLVLWSTVGPDFGEAVDLPDWMAGADSTGQYDQYFDAIDSTSSGYMISWAPVTFAAAIVLSLLAGAAAGLVGHAVRHRASGSHAPWLRFLLPVPFVVIVRDGLAHHELGIAIVAVLAGVWLDRMVVRRAEPPTPAPAT
ncbi:MAG: hypothetical protein PGN13_12980 [Patulibacter minatonensis]